VEVVKTFTDAEEAFAHLRSAEIDVLFLDIHLQSTSGIALLQRLKPVDFHVVFVTAYDEYAIKAFDLSATQYLLKPINGNKLKSAIQRIHESAAQFISEEQFSNIIGVLKNDLNNVHKIPFPVMKGIEFINPDDIVYIEGDNNYSNIHMKNGNKLVISKTLAYVEPKLSDYPFLRIHKSHIINLKYIAKYVKK
jgi:two-component system LytT family response regulator